MRRHSERGVRIEWYGSEGKWTTGDGCKDERSLVRMQMRESSICLVTIGESCSGPDLDYLVLTRSNLGPNSEIDKTASATSVYQSPRVSHSTSEHRKAA